MKPARPILLSLALILATCASLAAQTETPVAANEHPTMRQLEEQAQQFTAQIRVGEYEAVTAEAERLKLGRTRTTDGMSAYDSLVEAIADRIDADSLDAWVQTDPESSAPYTIMGEWSINEAWYWRTNKRAVNVDAEGWKGFKEYLEISRQALETAYAKDPQDYAACRFMITVMMGLGNKNKETMTEWYEKAIAIDPNYYEPCFKYSWAIFPRWMGSTPEIMEYIESLEGSDPRFGMITVNWIFWDNVPDAADPNSPLGQKGVELIQAYIDAYPQSGLARQWMSQALWKRGEQDEAIRWAKEAVALDPSTALLQHCATYLNQAGRYQEALDYANRLIAFEPGLFDGHAMIASIHHIGMGKHEEAIPLYTKALTLREGDLTTLLNRGDCYYEIGDYPQALADYQSAFQTRGMHGPTYLRLGKAYYKTGQKEEADKVFRRAVRLNPEYAEEIEAFKQE